MVCKEQLPLLEQYAHSQSCWDNNNSTFIRLVSRTLGEFVEPKEEIFTDEALEKETENKQIEQIVDEIVEEAKHTKTEEDDKK